VTGCDEILALSEQEIRSALLEFDMGTDGSLDVLLGPRLLASFTPGQVLQLAAYFGAALDAGGDH